jgi:RNA polymerase sigma factor (TIGR02999 family)
VPTEALGEVTRLLEEVAAGNEEAKRALFARVYEDLKKTAHGRMRRERPDHSWCATVLVHETYCRLLNDRRVFSKNRAYFFGAVARAMGQLLREHARRRKCRPEGHVDPQGFILLDHVVEEIEEKLPGTLTDLLEALDDLKTIGKYGERQHEVVKLHFFGGLTYKDIALNLGVGDATVERDWQAARAWLYGRLKGRRTDD